MDYTQRYNLLCGDIAFINHELKNRKQYNSPFQLRVYRQRLSKLNIQKKFIESKIKIL